MSAPDEKRPRTGTRGRAFEEANPVNAPRTMPESAPAVNRGTSGRLAGPASLVFLGSTAAPVKLQVIRVSSGAHARAVPGAGGGAAGRRWHLRSIRGRYRVARLWRRVPVG